MVYDDIGKTGMKVSNLCLGASSLRGVFQSIKEDDAVEHGINLIDGTVFLVMDIVGNICLSQSTRNACESHEILGVQRDGVMREIIALP